MADAEKHRDSLSLEAHDYEKVGLLAQQQQQQNDIESQTAIETPHEYQASSTKKFLCLALYFALNLGVTLSNKAVLQSAQYPWLLTAVHATTTSFGCFILRRLGVFHCTKLSSRDNLKLVAFSCLFTANIATSNVSLGLVSVPFHQVLRSTVPIVTILIYRWIYNRHYTRQIYLTMIPLISGVSLATFGDYYFTPAGFALTFTGVLLAAIKSISSNRMMTGTLHLSALEILYRMSPLAAAQSLICAGVIGEVGDARREFFASGRFFNLTGKGNGFVMMLVLNALMAFMLNGISFYTNKIAGALTISVCANLKQILTILLGIVLFHVHVTPVHGLGMVVALVGAAWYSKAELDAKRERERSLDLKK